MVTIFRPGWNVGTESDVIAMSLWNFILAVPEK
jgi:hypothetical protein